MRLDSLMVHGVTEDGAGSTALKVRCLISLAYDHCLHLPGAFSAVLAIAAFFIIHDTPSKVLWLTAEEKRFLILRHKFSAGGESGIAEKEEFSWTAAHQVFKVRVINCAMWSVLIGWQSFHVYACVLIEFTLCVVVYGVSFVLPTM